MPGRKKTKEDHEYLQVLINDKLRIRADSQNFMIERLRISKKGKTNSWHIVGFYKDLSLALEGVSNELVRDMGEVKLNKLNKKLDEIRNICNTAGHRCMKLWGTTV